MFNCIAVYARHTVSYIISLVRLRNDLYCVEWGVKLYSNQTMAAIALRERIATQYSEYSRALTRIAVPPPVPSQAIGGVLLIIIAYVIHRTLLL